MIVVALATAEATQIVGVLLVFALMVAPAASAMRLASGTRSGILLSILLAVATAWTGLALAYWTDWPTSFWIAALGAGLYLLSGLKTAKRRPIAG
jgi:zinc/manganese transport system permease protein